ncbi:ABC transporter family substrate-binding protein [Streptomyces sp. RFCAC02]|uniref:ABC transporter family substrate-binding protein n=1 Tax=Streptomyces sp. RFCAC02 TaxID=2499143 RepID=UPI00102205C7|nr:ABC transporter family substrate-binding protein [Streptomyces sp. RFCAC02]
MAGRTGGRAWWAVCAVGLMLAPLLSACTTPTEDDTVPVRALQSISTARRSQLRSGGTVRWAVDALPTTLNAYQFGADAVTDRVAEAVLPHLFVLDAEGRPRLDTDYLRSAEITEREPRQTVVYTLHPEARWSDGRRVGADDFIAQWQALNGKDPDYWSARNAGYDRIADVREGPGAHQVEVTFSRPYADWKSLFTPLYPRSVTGDPDTFNEGARAGLAVSGGPFEVAGVDEDAGTVTLARNDAWWGDPALLDSLVLTAVPRSERRDALAAGELDVAEITPGDADRITAARRAPAPSGSGATDGATGAATADDAGGDTEGANGDGDDGVPPGAAPSPVTALDGLDALARAHLAGDGVERAAETYRRAYAEAARARERQHATREEARVEALSGFTVHRAYAPSWTQLTLNGGSGALADERVRWAVARAVDRAALAGKVHRPAGLPAQPLGNHLRTLGQPGYTDNSDALGTPGAASAAALLDEAGWRAPAAAPDAKPGSAVPRAKDGEDLTLRFVVPDGEDARPQRAAARRIATMLAAAGIRAELTEVPAADFFDEWITPGRFDLALFSWPAGAYPATEAAPVFAKPRTTPGGDLLIGQNYGRVGTDYVDQLLDQAAGALDEEEYADLIDRADARIWASAVSVPLYQRPQLVAVGDGLAGVGAFGLATPRYQDIGHRR